MNTKTYEQLCQERDNAREEELLHTAIAMAASANNLNAQACLYDLCGKADLAATYREYAASSRKNEAAYRQMLNDLRQLRAESSRIENAS